MFIIMVILICLITNFNCENWVKVMLFSKKDSTRKKQERKHQRHNMYQATYYKIDDDDRKIQNCEIHNISLGGMFLEIKEKLEIGTKIVIVLKISGILLHEKLRIVHKQKIITSRYGCEFIDDIHKEKRDSILKQFL